MRIIGGEKKGVRLFEVRGIRPTADRVREAIFNILGDLPQGASVLDIFAGTGAMGLEALSRGAAYMVFVENSPVAVRVIQRNMEKLGYEDCSRLIQASASRVKRFLEKEKHEFGLIFMDPPYRYTQEIASGKKVYELIRVLGQEEKILPEALLVLEHRKDAKVPRQISAFHLQDQRRYGDTAISVFMKEKINRKGRQERKEKREMQYPLLSLCVLCALCGAIFYR